MTREILFKPIICNILTRKTEILTSLWSNPKLLTNFDIVLLKFGQQIDFLT